MRRYGAGKGDLVLSLAATGGLGYLKLWPHVRPLRVNRPQPMLRALTGAESVARLLAGAITAHAPDRVTLSQPAPPARAPAMAPGLTARAT